MSGVLDAETAAQARRELRRVVACVDDLERQGIDVTEMRLMIDQIQIALGERTSEARGRIHDWLQGLGDHTAIHFIVTFHDQAYHYAAIRIGQNWYTTSGRNATFTTAALATWLAEQDLRYLVPLTVDAAFEGRWWE